MLRALGIALAISLNAHAQVPPQIAEQLKAIGPVIDPPGTGALYAPQQEKEPYAGVHVTRDVKYGTEPRQALDLFVPEAPAGTSRPVLIFIHGGAFVGGDKRRPGSPFYDNIMLAAARAGIVGVNATYRLAPEHKWPTGGADVGLAVKWVHERIAKHGGDPKRVFLMGHSAGAVHAASYVAFPELQIADGLGLAGAILVSGLYAMDKMEPGKPELAYFGDKAGSAEVSSLRGLLAARIPLMVAYAGLDPEQFVAQGKLLSDALCSRGPCPRLVVLPEHSHMSEVYSINSPDKSLERPVLDFVKNGP